MTDDTTQRASHDPTGQPTGTHAESQFGHANESSPADEWEQSQLALEMAKEWVRQHQTVAMIGAFAVGAFIGALMRD